MKDKQSGPPQKPPLTSPVALVGLPIISSYPTPRVEDTIVKIRKDTRASGYKLPKHGAAYDGVDQRDKLAGKFKFSKSVPVDAIPGFTDHFYLREFADQERYNYAVEFEYVDRDFPKITRTYTVERTDDVVTKEPQADTFDPADARLRLTDHQIKRFEQDPVLDSMFVQILRVFERLPGPVVVSYEANQQQQLVQVQTQTVMRSAPPAQSAFTETAQQKRTGTAKAQNVLSKVPRVFPAEKRVAEIPSMTRELWLGGFTETSDQQIQAGVIGNPALSPGVYSVTESQTTEFKKEISLRSLPLPQTRTHKELIKEFGGGTESEVLTIDTPTSGLDVEEGFLITESRLRNLEGFGRIRMTKSVPAWPTLYESETDPKYGIVVQMRKDIVPAGTIYPPGVGVAPDEKFVDIKPAEKWRSIQIVSKIDPNSLPDDVSWDVIEHIDLPAIITNIGPAFHDAQSSEASTELYGVNTAADGAGSSDLQTHTHRKTRSTIGRAFITASALNRIAVGANFEIATTRAFLGFCPALVTRHFSFGAPPLGAYPNFPINTVTGMATVIERSFEEEEADGATTNRIKSATDMNIRQHFFGPVLVGIDRFGNSLSTTDKSNSTRENIISDGTGQNTMQRVEAVPDGNGGYTNGVLVLRHYYPNFYGRPSGNQIYASGSTPVLFITRSAATDKVRITGPRVVSEVRIVLPPSAPYTIVSGNQIVAKVEVEVYRLNVYVTYITTVTIP